MKWLRVAGLSATLVAFNACGSKVEGGRDVGPSGLPNQPADQLSIDDRGKLCDWLAAKWGGYGYERPCGDGTTGVGFHKDRALCLDRSFLRSCAVALYEDCAVLYEQARLAGRECVDGKPHARYQAACVAFFDCVEIR